MASSRLTPGAIYKAILLAGALVVAALVFQQLVTLILGVLVVVVIALPLSAFADLLARYRVPRPIGAAVGLLLGLAAVGGLVALIVPAFSHEVNQFVNSLPRIVDDLRHRVAVLTGTSAKHVGLQIQHFVNGYTHHPAKLLGPAEKIGASVAAAVAAIIVVLLTALYTAINPQPLVGGLIRLVPPPRRADAERLLGRLKIAYLGWLRGLAVGMLVLGGITYLGLLLVGLPFAAFFAVFTAVAMIVPYFGALASSIPPILFALTISPGKAVIVGIIYILAHQIESNVIQPVVVARTVHLHPAVVAVGVVAVGKLFGFVGLIVAVPVLVTVQILVQELWIRPMERNRRRSITDPEEEAQTEADSPATTVGDRGSVRALQSLRDARTIRPWTRSRRASRDQIS
jgi:predicted PurR-regulated permease PerM